MKTENSKMNDSELMIEERRYKTEIVTPDAQPPKINQQMEIEIVSASCHDDLQKLENIKFP